MVKFSASYRFDSGLTLGLFALWESGTPLSVFGGSKAGGFNYNFLRQRGTAGHPFFLDVTSVWPTTCLRICPGIRIRLVADAVHIGSACSPVDYEQIQYFNVDANGTRSIPTRSTVRLRSSSRRCP